MASPNKTSHEGNGARNGAPENFTRKAYERHLAPRTN